MAKTRRMRGPKGSGTISLRPDGRWHGRIDLGRGPDGKRDRKSIYGATEREVVVEMQRLHGHAADGDTPLASSPTIGSYARSWLALRDDLAAATRRSYDYSIERVLIPGLGAGTRVEKITRPAINKWYLRATADAVAGTGRRRSRTVDLALACLRFLLGDAVRDGLVRVNQATHAGRRVSKRERQQAHRAARYFTAEQSHQLAAAITNETVDVLVLVALALGLRLGEASGLTWSAIDLSAGEAHVYKQVQRIPREGDHAAHLAFVRLKTEKSDRVLGLPAFVVEALRRLRVRQQEQRLKAGKAWQKLDLVFATRTGGMLHPRNITRSYHRLLKRAGLPPVNFHGLRHSAASLGISVAGETDLAVPELPAHRKRAARLRPAPAEAHGSRRRGDDGSPARRRARQAVGRQIGRQPTVFLAGNRPEIGGF